MAAPLTRTSEAKGHQQVYDPSAAFRFEVPARVCGRRCRNFKSAALALTAMGTKLSGQTGIRQQRPRRLGMRFCNHQAARQDADRSFEHAHVLVEHEVGNPGLVEQRSDRRDEDCIVRADQLVHAPSLSFAAIVHHARQLGYLPLHHAIPMLPPSRNLTEHGGKRHRFCRESERSGEALLAVIVPFESQPPASIDRLVEFVAADMELVNCTILSRTSSDVTMIPEVANHLISSGGKRLRPVLTLAMARLAGYRGEGHVKLAAAVEFMHTATLLHDDVVDESEMRRGRLAARMLWGNEASVLVGDFLLGQAFK